jgi:hypothetical protein
MTFNLSNFETHSLAGAKSASTICIFCDAELGDRTQAGTYPVKAQEGRKTTDAKRNDEKAWKTGSTGHVMISRER